MLTLPPSVRIYIAAEPTNLRKSFPGLSALIESRFGQDPLSGHFFVFYNRRGDHLRVLFWDRTGYVIYGKKLARGRFHLASTPPPGAKHIDVESAELTLMLEGMKHAPRGGDPRARSSSAVKTTRFERRRATRLPSGSP